MMIDSNGAHIHVKQRGNGELALMFLHYYGSSARTWDAVADGLADRCRIVATDHHGWGDSEAPVDHYGVADLAANAEGVIEALGLRRYVLIGHSMRGKVAQLMAPRRPNGLKGPVLIAPSPPSPILLSDAQRATLTGTYQTRESVEFVTDHVLTAKPFSAAYHGQTIEDSLRGAPQAKSAWPELAMHENIIAITMSIDALTVVIFGELDQVDHIATLQAELLPHIPHAAMHVLPRMGYLSSLEVLAEVVWIVGQFVAAIEGKLVAYRSPDEVSAAFDTALNAGDLDAMLGLFGNQAMMRMTNGKVVQESPSGLHAGLVQLLSLRPRIRNEVRRVLMSGGIALVLLDWTLNVTLPDGHDREEHGTATQVMEKGRDGGWKLRISNPAGLN